MQWLFMPLRRYADFSGRSRRMEYWVWALVNGFIGGAIGALGAVGAETRLFSSDDELMLFFGLTLVPYALVTLVPSLAVAVRRLHDTDRSGWSILFGLVPMIGGLILLYFYVSEGTSGPNRFGPDPKA